jgi:ABC-2 type transport system ATP-binding protein
MNVPLDTADRAADVLVGLRQAGVSITSVSVAKPTLDEVFLAITGHGAEQAGQAGQAGEADRAGQAEQADQQDTTSNQAADDIPVEVK